MSGFADRTGLEPATSAVTGRHSNQLNYRSLIQTGLSADLYPPLGSANVATIFSNNQIFLKKTANNPDFDIFKVFPILQRCLKTTRQ